MSVLDAFRVPLVRAARVLEEARQARGLPVEVLSRWDFIVANVALLAIGTGALIAALMGENTQATPAVVRTVYVGVIAMGAAGVAGLFLIECGVAGVGPFARTVGTPGRDALYGAALVLAAAMLATTRIHVWAGSLVAVAAAGWIGGQISMLVGMRDLRRLANLGVAASVVAYFGFYLVRAATPCIECARGPWGLASLIAGAVAGVAAGWAARRSATTGLHGIVQSGTVLLVMAATFILVRDPVRASVSVLAIMGLTVAAMRPWGIDGRTRDLLADLGCLVLAGLEVLLGPAGTVPVGIVLLLVRGACRVPAGWPRVAVSGAVGILGVALSVNVVPPWDEPHYAFFLFPMRDLAAGKSLLAEINAQYGVGLIYVLTSLGGGSVEALTPTLLSAWTNATNVALYLCLAGLCAWLVKDLALASTFWLAVAANRFVSIGISESYPSTGAWRFGLPWLLVIDAAVPDHRKAPWRCVARVAFWAVAMPWSLEVALYCLVVVIADLALDLSAAARTGTVRDVRPELARRAGEVIVGATVGMALLVGDVWRRSGHLPDARHYLEYFKSYGAGLGFEQPVLTAAWWPMLLGCALAMTVMSACVILDPCAPGRRQAQVVALIAAYGILQLTYYVFRPHSNNLLHVIFPSAVVGVWQLSRLVHWPEGVWRGGEMTDPRALLAATTMVGVALIGAAGLTAGVPRVPTTLAGQAIRLWQGGALLSGAWFGSAPTLGEAGERGELRALLARRFPEVTRIPMLLADDLWIHAIVGTRYVNAFPLSFAPQDALVPVGVATAAASARGLSFGTEIVVETDGARLEGIRREMATILCGRGKLALVESAGRVVAARFVEWHAGREVDLCVRWGLTWPAIP